MKIQSAIESIIAICLVVLIGWGIYSADHPTKSFGMGIESIPASSITNGNFTVTSMSQPLFTASSSRQFLHIANVSTGTAAFLCLASTCSQSSGIVLGSNDGSWDMPTGAPYLGSISATTSPSSSSALLIYSISQ